LSKAVLTTLKWQPGPVDFSFAELECQDCQGMTRYLFVSKTLNTLSFVSLFLCSKLPAPKNKVLVRPSDTDEDSKLPVEQSTTVSTVITMHFVLNDNDI
jgi:hypothetical protein